MKNAASEQIQQLTDPAAERRILCARNLSIRESQRAAIWLSDWESDSGFAALVLHDQFVYPDGKTISPARLTFGIAVLPETFETIRTANGSLPLAAVPPDQDAIEFELHFTDPSGPPVRLDILSTKTPGGNGAIARFLGKFGEGVQQVEVDVTDVDRATEILRTRFKIEPIYPATRPGANGTRVNFFLVTPSDGGKVLVELVEAAENHP